MTVVPNRTRDRQPGHAKSQQLEDGREEGVVFKAIASAATADQLGLNGVQLERDLSSEQNVQVLEKECWSHERRAGIERRERWVAGPA